MNKTIRVCLAFFRSETRLSGETQSFLALVESVRAVKHVAIDVYIPLSKDLSDISSKKAKHASHIFSRFFKLFLFLYTLIRKSKHYDIIHVHFPTSAFLLFGDILKLFTSSKIVVSFDSTLVDVPLLPFFFRSLRRGFFYYIPRILINNTCLAAVSFKKADMYVVASDYQRKQLLDLGISSSKISIISNTTSELFLRSNNRIASRKKYSFKDEKIILYIGHFLHNKGVDLLLRAYARLRLPFKTRLVLAWSGIGNRKTIDTLAQQLGIRYTLFSQVDVPSLLSAADVVALPYVYNFATHSHPNLLLEAFAVGIPVVTSALPLTEAFTPLSSACYSFPPSDVAGLALQLQRALQKTKDRSTIAAAQRHYFLQHFSPQQSGLKTLTLYSHLIKKQKK